ncbi:hypothetical protein JW851_04310 [Candidatus Woesearchaeota archaeon]|nr:hypothetical protein [Candidatus Woesearchaeota archaeon]
MANKTRDGIKLTQIIQMLTKLSGVEIRKGKKHPYIAMYNGLRPCPVAASTDAKTMIVPWIEQASGYERNNIYSSLKSGKWYKRIEKK